MAMHKFSIHKGDELKNSLGASPTKHECNNIVENYEANNINFRQREREIEGGGMQFCIYEIRNACKFIM